MREFYGNPFFENLRKPNVGLCLCWKIMRGDGLTLRFTNHDQPITVDGETFQPSSSFSGSAVSSKSGLSVDNLNVLAIVSDDITEDDLMAGEYDDAEVILYLAQWTDVNAGLWPLKRGYIGEVKTMGQQFEAELRGLSERIQRTQGLIYTIECTAILGDARCTKDLTAFTHTATVTSTKSDDRTFRCDVVQPVRYFQYGTCEFTSGPNDGRRVEVLGHQSGGLITLLERMPYPIIEGTTVQLVAGCDKLAATCRTKFSNLLNFRGFPFMPTEEQAMATPNYKN